MPQRKLPDQVRNPATTIKALMEMLGLFAGNTEETEDGKQITLTGSPETSGAADSLTGGKGILRLLQGDADVGNSLDAVGVLFDAGMPGPPIAPLLAGLLKPLYHGGIASRMGNVARKGLDPARDIGEVGFPGLTKRIASFLTEHPEIGAGFANTKYHKTQRANARRTVSPTDGRLQEIADLQGRPRNEVLAELEQQYVSPEGFHSITPGPPEPTEAMMDAMLEDGTITYNQYMKWATEGIDDVDTPSPADFKSFEEWLDEYISRGSSPTPPKDAPVVLEFDPSVRALPNRKDKLFTDEQAYMFPEGVPPEYIKKAHIPIPGYEDQISQGVQQGAQRAKATPGWTRSPAGMKEVSIEEMLKFIGELLGKPY